MILFKEFIIKRSAIIILVLLSGCSNQKRMKLELPVNLNVINLDNAIMMEDVLSKKTKVVAFFRGNYSFSTVLPIYKSFIGKYDNIGFVFYINYKDDANAIEYLQRNEIFYPVFDDPKDSFLRANPSAINQQNTFMGFIINSENEILEATNPSLKGFGEKLSKLNRK